ncbi:MAG TPA: PilZ domain-containing protein [Tepidisphaeraceae bacterium]
MGTERAQGLGGGRGFRRYTIECQGGCRLLNGKNGEHRNVQIVNLSSSGLLLRCDAPLPVGIEVEVTIPWVASASTKRRLALHAVGRTVRSQGDCTAVQIDDSKFVVA